MSEATNDEIVSILNDIRETQTIEVSSENVKDKNNATSQNVSKKREKDHEIIRGRPKSGRFWKEPKERFSSINKTKGLKQDFQKKTSLRLELKKTKELSKQLQEELKQKELARKERRRENIKRTEENRKKSEIVQIITNTAKLKKMKKKQLRFIEKRDTSKVETSSSKRT